MENMSNNSLWSILMSLFEALISRKFGNYSIRFRFVSLLFSKLIDSNIVNYVS